MKKVILSLALVVGFTTANAQTKEDPKTQTAETAAKSTIDFVSKVIDYGTIDYNADGERKFVFTNNGTEPLIIKNAKGSCGCTVPEWPKELIDIGGTAKIKVTFNSGSKKGKQNKTITLVTNAMPSTKVLLIKGTILVP